MPFSSSSMVSLGTMNGMIECCFPRLTDSITRWQHRRRNYFGNLPKDLVPEILSRLPLTCVIRCRVVCKQWYEMIGTQFFLEMHYNNQPNQETTFALVSELPDEVIAVGYYDLFFSMNKKAADWKRFEMLTQLWVDGLLSSTGNRHLNLCQTTLISSYKGFLLITTNDLISELALILYNPLTGEEVTVVSPASRYAYCGFFFHSTTKEYTVLYQVFEKEDVCVGFEVYGLQTRSLRKINTNFSAKHHPDSSRPAVISNGCLYWMVSETHHMNTFGILPSCSEAILSFEIESEEFSLMPHPPVFHDCVAQGSSPPRHNKMYLLDMEGQLCLCNVYSLRVEIWVMEDYTKWIWVKRHVVKLDSFLSSLLYSGGLTYAEEIKAEVKAVQIHQGELLLDCITPQFGREYFLCRLKRDPNACRDNKDFEHHLEHVILGKYKHFQVAIDRMPIFNHSSSDEEMVRRIVVKNLCRGSCLSGMVVLTHSLISLHKSEPRRLKLVLPSP